MTIVEEIQAELASLADPERALQQQKYFKTGAGQYGEGDVFRGIRVPVLRKVSKKYQELTVEEVEVLLRSAFHEDRLLALLIMVDLYANANHDENKKQQIYDSYLRHTAFVNNWDLVDSSAHQIVGAHLMNRSKEPLYELAKSSLLWERRIAIMATFHYIKRYRFDETLKIAEMLLHDPENLIHKAVGWMLREIGKRNQATEEAFLRPIYRQIPRVMLRYAIERFDKEKRRQYLRGRI
ncbi:MAG: DNA alkylation repair protein [Ardenticatenaceae bacterium]